MKKPDLDAVRLAAAAWLTQAQSGVMDAAETERLAAWLDADESHRRAFDDITCLWEAIEPMRRAPSIMQARELAHRSIRRQATIKLLAPIAAIAVIALGVGLYRLLPATPKVYETQVGQTSAVRLADGSRITLDTNSAVRVWPRGRERRLELMRGRAHFEVAKNPNRPFVVRAGQGSVTALGTVFDVQLQRQGMKVVLVEGRVRVQGPASNGQAVFLKAGAAVEADGGVWRMSRIDARKETSWLTGELVFDEAPLSVVVAELNRYSDEKIRIADRAIGERRLSAVLRAGDSAMFTQSVERLNLARVRREDPHLLILETP